MSSRPPSRLSAEPSAPSMCATVSRSGRSPRRCASACVNRCAACSGCCQVVADRGEEARLVAVGALGRGAGARQFAGALGDALLQRLVRAREVLFGAAERGDVGEGRDETATGHRVAADLDHGAVRERALGQMRRARTHLRQPPLHARVDVAGAGEPAREVVPHQLGHRPADRQQAVGIGEQFGVAAVPRDHVERRVDHADALAHVLQRRLEHALVEAQVLAGLADDGGDRVELAAAFAPRHLDQQARRRGADHAGQLVLDRGDRGGIGAAVVRRIAEQRDDPLARQEARGQRLQFGGGKIAVRRDGAVARPARARGQREHRDVHRQAGDHRARQFAPVAQPEQLRRRQRREAERPAVQQRRGARQQGRRQHVEPDQAAGDEAERDRARADRRPVHRHQHRRHQAGQRRERQRADVGQRVAAGERARIRPGQQQHREDRCAALAQHRRTQVAGVAATPAGAHAQRRDPVVADHQAQRQRGDDDHAGRRAESAEEAEHGQAVAVLRQRQGQHVQVRRHAQRAQPRRARLRQRQDRQRDQAEVEREQPARGAHVAGVAALDHAGVELVRQGERGERAEQHQRRHAAAVARLRRGRRRDVGQLQHERADRQHRDQLEYRLERERQHQPAVVRGGRRAARAEQHREQRHRQRDVERAVLPGRRGQIVAAAEQRIAHRHRLQLQRDVRHDAQRGHRGDQRGQTCVPAEPRGDQVGQRAGVVLARQPHQPHQHAGGEHVQQDQADEGRRQPPARTFGLGDRAVERPRRAVHAERQRVDDAPAVRQHARMAFAVQRDAEQQDQPDQAGERDEQFGERHEVESVRARGGGATPRRRSARCSRRRRRRCSPRRVARPA